MAKLSSRAALSLGVIVALQITTAWFAFHKWTDSTYKDDKITGSSSSDYKNSQGNWRGMWEMQGFLSDLGKGDVYPGNQVEGLTLATVGSGGSDKMGSITTGRANGVPAWTGATTFAVGQITGATACTTNTSDTTGCYNGECLDGLCVCEPSYYGEQCQSPLSQFGVVTMTCD